MTRDGARQFAREAIHAGRPLAWFERLYRAAAQGRVAIPWADQCINPHLQEWLVAHGPPEGRQALVVGCGLGDDAEGLAACGLAVTGCDIAPSAIAACRDRFPSSSAQYVVGDILAPPLVWRNRFDFIFEAYTLQVLTPELRIQAVPQIASLLAPGGTLLVVTRLREPHESPGQMPWPLTHKECDAFAEHGLRSVLAEDFWDRESPPVRRMRTQWLRPET